MPTLEVPNALIFYTTSGSGPLLLLIVGGSGSGTIFTSTVLTLAKHYTVITYDRRGFSNSLLTGPTDLSDKLTSDAYDAKALLDHVAKSSSQDPQAYVFGTSSGCIVGLKLLEMYPESVRRLVAHEPPAISLLPEGEVQEQVRQGLLAGSDIYRTQGPVAAGKWFAENIVSSSDAALVHNAEGSNDPERRANMMWWWQFEYSTYPLSKVNKESIVREKRKIVPAKGEDTEAGMLASIIDILGVMVGRDVECMPGAHIGYALKGESWGAKLVEILARYA